MQLLHLLLIQLDVLLLLPLFLHLHFQLLCNFGTLPFGRKIVLGVDTRLARLVKVQELFSILLGSLRTSRRIGLVSHQLLLNQLKVIELANDVATRVIVYMLLEQLGMARPLRFDLLVVAAFLVAADDHANIHGIVVVGHVEAARGYGFDVGVH